MNANGAAPIRLPQSITLNDAVAVLAQLEQSVGEQAAVTVKVDASQLQVFDSSAVAVLLELRRKLLEQGKALQVEHWPQRLCDLVNIYGVSELLPA